MDGKRPRPRRTRTLSILLKRGHCAPSVMEAMLRARRTFDPGLVKLVGGLPGGIGNTGGECGGITSPLALFGLDGAGDAGGGPSLTLARSRTHMRRFAERHGTLFCREIYGEKHRLLPCIKAVLDAPRIQAWAASGDGRDGVSEEEREAIDLLASGLAGRGFHCARSVLDGLPEVAGRHPEISGALTAFLGGTACAGLTCGALTAGVMIAGGELARIERSYLRVFRMIVVMKTGGDALADRINAFNASVSLGGAMAAWFEGRFGGTQCRAIAGADFASAAGVRRFLDDGAAACERIPRKVAAEVRRILEAGGAT